LNPPEDGGHPTPFVALNDTGIKQYLGYQSYGTDTTAVPVFQLSQTSAAPGQDADYGNNSLSFTKQIGLNRSDLENNAEDWDCVRDNITGLTWEHKNTKPNNPHNASIQYNWHIPVEEFNGGFAGTSADGRCADIKDNTWSFMQKVNSEQLCGYTDWRLPTTEELRSLIDYSVTTVPKTNATFFPNVAAQSHLWTADTDVLDRSRAIGFHMHEGNSQSHDKTCELVNEIRFGNAVMLVRGGSSESPIN